MDGPNTVGAPGVNTAVSECGPTESELVDVDAAPAETVTGEPMAVVPSMNCTVPVTVDGLIESLRVTDIPAVCELAGVALSVEVVGVTGTG